MPFFLQEKQNETDKQLKNTEHENEILSKGAECLRQELNVVLKDRDGVRNQQRIDERDKSEENM